ncbi:MAG: TonB-dependent receptor [Cyclobacteriaceae bacterium]|nr:TonB-dependent receptor [Cyclobacteriaceae bacterium]MCH8514760.1 TonB-dependent receptor [Cyclobacteriaceae bacterium]
MNKTFSSISIFLLSIFFASSFTYAQVQISGKVVDRVTGDPIEFTNAAFLSVQDSSVVGGSMTGLDGSFTVSLSPGEYLLRVGFVGYETLMRKIEVGNSDKDLGRIGLKESSELLQEVQIEAAASMFKNDIDKKVFNVENTVVAEGGSAIDLLETLPSVQVDENGNISMRGTGDIQIFINGRPTNMMASDTESVLEQFPANTIESVELITNPSSRYEAQGSGGIINIILKKNKLQGFNGQVNGAVGTRDKYNGGVNLNYRSGKMNAYTSYAFQSRRLWQESESFRENFRPGSTPIIDQDFYTEWVNTSHNVRTGIQYDITKKQNVEVFFNGNINSRDRDREYNFRNRGLNNDFISDQVRFLMEEQFGDNFETGITYSYDIDSAGQKVYFNSTYSWGEQDRLEEFRQFDFFEGPRPNVFDDALADNSFNQLYGRPSRNTLFLAQLDYEKPFSKNRKIEMGLKANLSFQDRTQTFSADEGGEVPGLPTDSINRDFAFQEDVYAAYVSFRDRVGDKFGYQIGLRAEQTFTTGFRDRELSDVVNNYFNLFPSVFTSYDLNDRDKFQANYSRRIRRPGTWALADFFNVQDPLNLRIGNPFLQPELTDSYEVSYVREGKMFFTGSLFHRSTSNGLSRLARPFPGNPDAVIQEWENASSRNNTGLELINQYNPVNWFDATLTTSFFYSSVELQTGDGQNFNNTNFSYNINLMSNMRIPNWFGVQIMGTYQGPIVLPQGEIRPIYGLNIGLKRDFLDKKLTLSVNVSDIFDTRRFRLQTEEPNAFAQVRNFNRETRIGTISLTYRFGNLRESKRGDRRGRDGGNRGEGDDEGMF